MVGRYLIRLAFLYYPAVKAAASWHSCSGSLSPIIAPIPGIPSEGEGVADGYTRSSEMYSGAPIWRGVSNGYVAYMCGGNWMFSTSEASYLAQRAECLGCMVRLRSSGKWEVWTGSEFIDAAPSISCGSVAHLTRAPSHSNGWHSCSGGLSPIIAPVPGISTTRGFADAYTRSSETYSGVPIWRGVSNGYVAYKCGVSALAGRWMFLESEASYIANRAKCAGVLQLIPSGQLWQVYSGSEFIDAELSISCGSVTSAPSHSNGWHSCSGSLSPIIAPVPGIQSAASGVADGYTRSSETYSGSSTWHGVSNGYVAYVCGGSNAGRWMLTTSEARYLADRAECKGVLWLNLSGEWHVYTGSEWINARPSILCVSAAHLTRTPSHSNDPPTGWSCDLRGCQFSEYTEGVDWTYYDRSSGDCKACASRCEADSRCTGIECGSAGYCSAWFHGACTVSTNTAQGMFLTCRRPTAPPTLTPTRTPTLSYHCVQGGTPQCSVTCGNGTAVTTRTCMAYSDRQQYPVALADMTAATTLQCGNCVSISVSCQ